LAVRVIGRLQVAPTSVERPETQPTRLDAKSGSRKLKGNGNMSDIEKSTLKEIEARFDNEVERFSNLDTGQVSTIDAKISLEILAKGVAAVVPDAKAVLDLGCGAGNFTLKLLELIPSFDSTLVDLSKSMLDRAFQRVSKVNKGRVNTVQADFLSLELPESTFDAAITGAALHHLRSDREWEAVFTKIYKSLKPGGCFFISDLISHEYSAIHKLMWQRYADYLLSIGDKEYQESVFAYIEKEDTPRSVTYQLDLMKRVGFSSVDILHKNSCFAVFGGIR